MTSRFLNRARTAVAAALVLLAPVAFAQTIKIGLITDKVGPAKGYAEPVAQGAIYAVKELNAKGGLLGPSGTAGGRRPGQARRLRDRRTQAR